MTTLPRTHPSTLLNAWKAQSWSLLSTRSARQINSSHDHSFSEDVGRHICFGYDGNPATNLRSALANGHAHVVQLMNVVV